MNGAHDMGGADGFGPVVPERDEPMFHAEWERRAMALTIAMAMPGGWNIDMSRFAREDRSPSDYLSKSYYQIWLAALERLMVERNLVTSGEIAQGKMLYPAKQSAQVLTRDRVPAMLSRGAPTVRESNSKPQFAVGDRVRAKNMHPEGHTRLPRYVRGRAGIIERLHGCHVFADSHASGAGENPQWLYTVGFSGLELWGEQSKSGIRVSVDAWEPYLEAAV